MTFSVYDVTVPVFTRMLTNLLAIMDKAEANAAERKFDTLVLANARLSPDMIPFRGQVMIATDAVKGCVCRLAGKEVPSWPDTEETFPELRARIGKALELLATFTREDLEGGETRELTVKVGGKDVTMSGLELTMQRSLPNFFFHVTTAYAILRHNGVAVGKRDYLG